MRAAKLAELAALYTVPIIFFIYVLIFDDTPNFPLPDSSDPIDCINIHPRYPAEVVGGNIKLEFDVDEFLQYPREVAPYLISVGVSRGSTRFFYKYQDFQDISNNLSSFSFSIRAQIDGQLNISIYCHRHLLSSSTVQMNGPLIPLDGQSSIGLSYGSSVKLESFCIQNGTLLLFSNAKAEAPAIRVCDNTEFPVIFKSSSMSEFVKSHPNFFIHPGLNFLLGRDSYSPIYPALSYFISAAGYGIPANLVVLSGHKSEYSDLLRFNPPITIQDAESKCFSKGEILRLPSSSFGANEDQWPSYNSFISSFRPGFFSKFRGIFTNSSAEPNRIIIEDTLQGLISDVKSECPNCSVLTLSSSMGLVRSADDVARSRILIAKENLLFSLFLNENCSLIEIDSNSANFERTLNINRYSIQKVGETNSEVVNLVKKILSNSPSN